MVVSGCTPKKNQQIDESLKTHEITPEITAEATFTAEATATVLPSDVPTETPIPTVEPTATPDSKTGTEMYITGDKVNIRSEASSTSDKLGTLEKGTKVIAYNTVNEWTYISYGTDKYGYVATKYLSTKMPSNQTQKPAATPTPKDEIGDGSFDLPEDEL